MRFVHTADWQIGMAAAHVGEAGARVREARLEAAKRVLGVAHSQAAQFMVVAGDTFENNTVARSAVAEVARILGAAPCPVFVLPGNHDPLVPGSVWDLPVWRDLANVTVLREPKPVPVSGGTLFPCPLTRKRGMEDPTGWIPAEPTPGIRIGVAHGNVGDLIGDEGGFPITFDCPTLRKLDYVALGHWHSYVSFGTRMAYSGTHETTKFGEKDSGNVLLVEIAGPGAEPTVTKIRTGLLTWEQIAEEITAPGKIAEIIGRLIHTEDVNHRLIEITLSGLLFERDRADLVRLRAASTPCLYSRIDDSLLRPAPEDRRWIDSLPPGVLRETAERLWTLSTPDTVEGVVATQALHELYALQTEVAQ